MHSSEDEFEDENSFFDDLFKDNGEKITKNSPLRKNIIKSLC